MIKRIIHWFRQIRLAEESVCQKTMPVYQKALYKGIYKVYTGILGAQ